MTSIYTLLPISYFLKLTAYAYVFSSAYIRLEGWDIPEAAYVVSLRQLQWIGLPA